MRNLGICDNLSNMKNKYKMDKRKIIEDICDPEALLADGFDEAILGLCSITGRIVYCMDTCIEVLKKQGMDEDEAYEYFSYNVSGAYVGEMTPIFIDILFPSDFAFSNVIV